MNGYLPLNLHICGYLLYTRYLDRTSDRRWYVPFVMVSIVWATSIHTVTAFLYCGLGGRRIAERGIAAGHRGEEGGWLGGEDERIISHFAQIGYYSPGRASVQIRAVTSRPLGRSKERVESTSCRNAKQRVTPPGLGASVAFQR